MSVQIDGKYFNSVKEMFEYIDSLPKPSWFKRLEYKIDNLRHGIPRGIKFFFQRITRGFDDSDLWSLDYTVAKFMLPRYKLFKKLHNHIWYDEEKYPDEFLYQCGELKRTKEEQKVRDKEDEEYTAYVLNEIEWFLEQAITDTTYEHCFTNGEFDKQKSDEYNKRYEKVCILFGKYFRRLWT